MLRSFRTAKDRRAGYWGDGGLIYKQVESTDAGGTTDVTFVVHPMVFSVWTVVFHDAGEIWAHSFAVALDPRLLDFTGTLAAAAHAPIIEVAAMEADQQQRRAHRHSG